MGAGNDLGEADGVAIAEALKTNKTLHTLHLGSARRPTPCAWRAPVAGFGGARCPAALRAGQCVARWPALVAPREMRASMEKLW